jgi:hypothetical protein
MPIQLEETRGSGTPVIKHRAIGEKFVGGILKFETRDLMRDGEIQYKDDGVTPRKELVVTVLTKTSTMVAGIGDDESVPEPGSIVRVILRGGGFGQWIDAKKTLGRGVNVGDLLYMDTTHAIRYNASTYAQLGRLDTQDQVAEWETSPANIGRKESLGRYGDLKLRAATDTEAGFVVECEQAYHQLAKQGIALEDRPGPFDTPAAAAPAPSTGDDDLWG